MALDLTIGQTDVNILDNGKTENNMERDYLLQLLGWKGKVIGKMDRELVGKIMNDFLL